jgi:hypothetical protein
MTAEHWETIRAVLILLGGLATGVVTSRTVRKSQKESSQITLATDLINQIQEERDRSDVRVDASERREGLWRTYTRKLRAQIYKMGGEPVEPPDELGV